MLSKKAKVLLKDVLNPKEIKIYEAAMQTPASVQELATKTSIDRVQVYRLIKDLADKGLVSQEIKKHGRTIRAEHPRKLVNLLANKQRKIRRNELILKDLLPEVLGDYNVGEFKPKIKFYEGREGYFDICEQTLNSHNKHILALGNLTELHKIIGPEYDLKYYAPARKEKSIFASFLLEESELIKKELPKNKEFLREIKFLPKDILFNSFKYIYDNKVAIISSTKELISLVIESYAIADMEGKTFKLIWNRLSYPATSKTKEF